MTAPGATDGLTVYHRIEDLPTIWDTVARQAGLGLDRRFLYAMQQSMRDGRGRRYIVYRAQALGTVIATGELLHKPGRRNPVIDVLLGRLKKKLPATRDWLLPMLALRTELSSDAPLCVLPREPAVRRSLLEGMLAALDEYAACVGCSLTVDCVPSDDIDLTGALRAHSYLETLARPFAELRLEWNSWEAYLKAAAKKSKNAAGNIRNEVNRSRRDGLTIEEWDPARVPEADLYRLLGEHERRLNRRDYHLTPTFLGNLTRALGSNARVLLARHGNQIQGVVVVAWAGRRGYVVFPGLIEKAERAGHVYFNLTYYQPIRLAIALGLERLAYGNAAFAAKIRRGCTATARGLFFRPRSAPLCAALRPPLVLHRQWLRRKYGAILRADPFSSLR